MKRLLVMLALTCVCTALRAQCELHGRVTDTEGAAIGYATVVAAAVEGSSTGTTSDGEGLFSLRLPAGSYTLTVRFVGYEEVSLEAALSGEEYDAGTIVLSRWERSVGDVVVTADRIRREADRFVVEVGPSDTGKDAAEIVSHSPGVRLDDNGLSINGQSGTKLYVDGREIRLSGKEAVAYLRRMRSEDIARIEVIPTAGADYAADAKGGVIVVRSRRRSGGGISCSAGYQALVGGSIACHRPSVSVDAGIGRWTLSAAAGASISPRDRVESEETRTVPTAGEPFYTSGSSSDQRNGEYTARMGAFVDIDSCHSLGVEAEYASTRLRAPSEAYTQLICGDCTAQIAGSYDALRTTSMFSAAVDYTFRTDTLGSALRIVADCTLHRSDSDNDYAAAASTPSAVTDTLYRNTGRTRYRIVSADASFDRHFGSGLAVKTGLRYMSTRLDDSSLWYGSADGAWLPQENYDSANDYSEGIAAAYATLRGEVGRIGLSAGIRGEYSVTRKRGDFDRRSFDLFPDASLTFCFDDARRWILAVNYARNIERPTFSHLDPARIQLSEYSYIQGNPDLRPTYIHRINATLIYRYRFTLTLGGNLHRDLIREMCMISDYDASTSFVMPVNHYSENHWFAAVNLPFRIGRIINLTVNAVGVDQRIRTHEDSTVASHGLLFAGAVVQLFLPADLGIEASWSGNTRLYSGNSEIAPWHTCSLAVRKRLCRGRLALSAGIYNIFDLPMAYDTHPGAYDGHIVMASGLGRRHFRAGVSWSFEKGRKSVERRIERGDEDTRRRLTGANDTSITKNK